MRNCIPALLFSGLCLLVTSRAAKGQLMTTGTLNGMVTDTSGASVPMASVTITNMATNSVIEAGFQQGGQVLRGRPSGWKLPDRGKEDWLQPVL
jgi:hypothetical protein